VKLILLEKLDIEGEALAIEILIGKWSLPWRSWRVFASASKPRSQEAIDKSMLELACPEEEIKVGEPSFKTIRL